MECKGQGFWKYWRSLDSCVQQGPLSVCFHVKGCRAVALMTCDTLVGCLIWKNLLKEEEIEFRLKKWCNRKCRKFWHVFQVIHCHCKLVADCLGRKSCTLIVRTEVQGLEGCIFLFYLYISHGNHEGGMEAGSWEHTMTYTKVSVELTDVPRTWS